ncbi:transglutaminase family protein [Paracoccaceae bacterium Fryx2]|nr:transglutaminase family protein [Paracoccaceae bacterium Fryx2]
MLYDVSLGFSYAYRSTANSSRHLLRLMPQTVTGRQDLVSGLVTIDPDPDYRQDVRDFFGNPLTVVAYDRPLKKVTFRLRARVRRLGVVPGPDLSPPLSGVARAVAGVLSIGAEAPHHFLGPSDRVRAMAETTAYAREAVPGAGSVWQAVQAVGMALHRDMTFDSKATDVDTETAEAFRKRRGVCQDFSHVMIACLRGLGIPAGYVSGFLRTVPPPGKERLEGADAMHAWVQAWCGPQMGWVEFDPTNAMAVGQDHVVVALGRDYSDVAPVKGALRTTGSHTSRQSVDVIPLPDQT